MSHSRSATSEQLNIRTGVFISNIVIRRLFLQKDVRHFNLVMYL
jgi:hypothetical protein